MSNIHLTCRGKSHLIIFTFKLGHQRKLNHVFVIEDHIFAVLQLLEAIQLASVWGVYFRNACFPSIEAPTYSSVLLPLCCSWIQLDPNYILSFKWKIFLFNFFF